ncbi:hypothetical protein BGZ65_000942 [Modicella reniformis]|uniref:DUF221-domain-containing protein n=1 Tax=Modicella reniformis TaxID=1440133 RepID=A0A9P6LUD6_9FUNG|nr:hypothetical protein BGZ65_000942 [Modicella reniformis]
MDNNSTSSDPNDSNVSVKAFTSSLLFNAAIGAGFFVAFCIVRHWSKKIYQPRTYLVSKDIQSPELPAGAFSWITASFKVKDTELLEKVGLDAYMFLRFLRMSGFLFAGCTVLAIPILIPLNMIGGINQGGLVAMNIVATMALLWQEMREFSRRRHAYLMSEKHNKTPQSTTILVTAIPKGLNTEKALYNIFNRFPGGVSKIWLNRHPSKIVKLCQERDHVVKKLEMAEYQYIRSAYGKRSKNDPEIKKPKRPFGRISNIPCVGRKVDLIEFYTNRLCQLNLQIETAQRSGSVDSLNSAFIQFHSQFGAHSAVQTVVHPTPFQMAPMYAEISPLDVVWDNMNLDTIVRKGRHMVIIVISTVMIMLWTVPTVIVSSLASISDIVNAFKFLAFLEDLPPDLFGIIEGVFPPVLLAGLMALLPFILIIMATYEGHVRHSSIDLSVMSKYFFFLVTNVLLISTLSGGILKTINQLQDEGFKFDLVIRRFSEKLPQASTFFITYVLLRGFTGPALELLQIIPLLLNFFFTHLLAKSPHQIWDIQGRLEFVNYGIIFPPQTLIFCIGILYSTIAPIILPFVTFYFTMHYFVYRHQFLYVYLQPVETGGLAFPKAVKQVYTGMFISQITLFGLFLMKQAEFEKPAVPQLVIIIILIVITALSLSNMNEAFRPLVTFLPVALFSEDLHVDEDGVVTDGNKKSAVSRRSDEEEADDMYGYGMCLDNLSKQNLASDNRPRFSMTKEEYHGNGIRETNDTATVLQANNPTFPGQSFRHRYRHHHQNSTNSFAGSQRQYDRPVSFMDRPTASFENNRPASFIDQPAIPEADGPEDEHWPETNPVNRRLEDLQDQAYCHPAIYNVQKPVWLPMDERQLAQTEIERFRSYGIAVATDGAVLDSSTAKARVSGIIYAPGEETRYRLERGE